MEFLEKENFIRTSELEDNLIDWCIENIDISKGFHIWDYPETAAFGCECDDDEDKDQACRIGDLYVVKRDSENRELDEELTISYCVSCEAWTISKT